MRTTAKRLVVAGALVTALAVPAGVAVATTTGATGGAMMTAASPGPGNGPGSWRGQGMGMWSTNDRPGGCLGGSAKARELRQEHWQDMQKLRTQGGTWEDMQRLRREHQREMQRLWESR